jgi:hypothetical protein
MVENVSSVREIQVERPRPPEPQERPERPEQRAGGDGEPTPPNNIALLADTAGAALLRVQEAASDYDSAEAFVSAADTDGDRAIAREELQKLIEKNSGERSAEAKAATDRLFDQTDSDRNGSVTKEELDGARSRARAINIGA